MLALAPLFEQLVVGKARANLLESDAGFETRQRLADAEVVAMAKVECALGHATHIEVGERHRR